MFDVHNFDNLKQFPLDAASCKSDETGHKPKQKGHDGPLSLTWVHLLFPPDTCELVLVLKFESNLWSLKCKKGVAWLWPGDLDFDQMW